MFSAQKSRGSATTTREQLGSMLAHDSSTKTGETETQRSNQTTESRHGTLSPVPAPAGMNSPRNGNDRRISSIRCHAGFTVGIVSRAAVRGVPVAANNSKSSSVHMLFRQSPGCYLSEWVPPELWEGRDAASPPHRTLGVPPGKTGSF
jgi:hypothetical protein